MIGQAMKHPGNYFYVFPTREAAKKALWEKIDRDGKLLLSAIPSSRLMKKSDQEMLIKIYAGADGKGESTIRVIGLDYNPDSIRGITPRGLVFSEFAYQDADVYKTILPALQQYPDAWVIYNSTPNGKNHFYDLFERTKHAPGWFSSYHQVLYPDKPGYISNLISLADIRMLQAESGLDDEFVEQEFGCSFELGAAGSVYGNQMVEAEKQGRIGCYPFNSWKAVDTFWDLGLRDATVIWFRQMNGAAEYYFDYIKVSGFDYPEIVDLLVDKQEKDGYRYRSHFIPHDGDRQSIRDKLTDEDFINNLMREKDCRGRVEACPKQGKRTSIKTLKSLFSNFYFNCPNYNTDLKKTDPVYEGVTDLFDYHWVFDKKKKVYTQEPYHDDTSHTCDALATRVAAMYLDSAQRYGNVMNNRSKPLRYKDFDPLAD